MRTTTTALKTSRLKTSAARRGLAVALVAGSSLVALSGCVAYEPYPAAPVYGGGYYSAPAPAYYYPCCATSYSFSYSHRDYDRGYHRGGGRGYDHHHGWR